MAKKSTTSLTVSTSLKAALQAKNAYPPIDVNQTYYNGANEVHLLISDMSDGTYRCVIQQTSGVSFDFHTISDPAYIREWTQRELGAIIGNYDGVQSSEAVQQGANWTHTIVRNGQSFQATDQNPANAQALAFIAVLNAS